MGKKKEYNLSEIDTKQVEDNGVDKKESFTVQEYDAIVNDGLIGQPCKQSEDGDQDKVEDDNLSVADQTEEEKRNEPIQTQADCKGEENVNHQPTTDSMDNHIDNIDDDTETSKKQKLALKTEECTTIDLEETKHEPDPPKVKPVMFWLRKNLCLIIGISFVIALIAVISITATTRGEPSGEQDELMARKGNTAGFKPAKDEYPNDTDYNPEVESTTQPLQSTETGIGNTPWATISHSARSHNDSTTESVMNVTKNEDDDFRNDYDDYDEDYSAYIKNLTYLNSEGVI